MNSLESYHPSFRFCSKCGEELIVEIKSYPTVYNRVTGTATIIRYKEARCPKYSSGVYTYLHDAWTYLPVKETTFG